MIPKFKWLILIIVILCITLTSFFLFGFSKFPFLVVFCDVGQGDATLVKYEDFQVLIDGGPDDSIIKCLDKYMYNDKQIELAFLTHADKDHFMGFTFVMDYYHVGSFVIPTPEKFTDDFKYFDSLIKKRVQQGMKVYSLNAGDTLSFRDLDMKILWPTKRYSQQYSDFSIKSDSEVNHNLFSYVILIQYKELDVLVNGDADSEVQPLMLATGLVPRKIEIMTSPHHGSASGIYTKLFQMLDPHVVVISVGENNSYGHPAKSILQVFSDNNKVVHRTDLDGTIVYTVKDGILKRLDI